MSQHNVFLALPEDLYAEVLEISATRGISVSDLLIEALSDSIEKQRDLPSTAERLRCRPQASPRVH